MGVFNRTERSTGSEFPHYREDWAFRATYSYGNRYFLEYNGAVSYTHLDVYKRQV